METALIVLAALILVTVVVSRINAKYEAKQDADEMTPDARVALAWDDFGLTEDLEQSRAALTKLLVKAPVEQLEDKASLVRLAIMSIRAEHYDPLPLFAARAEAVATGCGETLGIQGLAEAYAGEPERARTMLEKARRGLAGCAGCSGDADGKILVQEVGMALDALSGDEANLGGRAANAGPGASLDPADRTAANYSALAAKHRTDSAVREGDPELAAPDTALERADEWVDREPARADAWLAKGIALTRLGSLEVAERALGRAIELDASCWPAYLGSSVLFRERAVHGLTRVDKVAAESVADTRVSELLGDMVDGWSALSVRERGVLCLSARPLGELLDALVDSGARLRIVPVHVRAEDVGFDKRLGETVFVDSERYDALGLYATATRAYLRWDVLADASPGSLLLAARAFAMMASTLLPESLRREFAAIDGAGDNKRMADLFSAAYADRVKSAIGDLDRADPGRDESMRKLDQFVERATAA